MRRGCVCLGERTCSECHRPIAYAARYLVVDEGEGENKTLTYYCVDCAIKKGYGEWRGQKSERTLTFFTSEAQPNPQ